MYKITTNHSNPHVNAFSAEADSTIPRATNTLCAKLKTVFEKSKLSEEDFASILEVKKGSLTNMFGGRNGLSKDHIKKLDAAGIDVTGLEAYRLKESAAEKQREGKMRRGENRYESSGDPETSPRIIMSGCMQDWADKNSRKPSLLGYSEYLGLKYQTFQDHMSGKSLTNQVTVDAHHAKRLAPNLRVPDATLWDKNRRYIPKLTANTETTNVQRTPRPIQPAPSGPISPPMVPSQMGQVDYFDLQAPGLGFPITGKRSASPEPSLEELKRMPLKEENITSKLMQRISSDRGYDLNDSSTKFFMSLDFNIPMQHIDDILGNSNFPIPPEVRRGILDKLPEHGFTGASRRGTGPTLPNP
jgi:hypothetical protein